LVVSDAHSNRRFFESQQGRRAFHGNRFLYGSDRQFEIDPRGMQGADLHVEAHHSDETFLAHHHLVKPALQRAHGERSVGTGLGDAAKAGLLIRYNDDGGGHCGVGWVDHTSEDVRHALCVRKRAQEQATE